MNIFYLDKDPILAAQMLCDRHVVKMGLEAFTLLKNAHIVQNGGRASWGNHPCSVWARASPQNYVWLWKHMVGVFTEYTYRYRRTHSYVINGKVKQMQPVPGGPWRVLDRMTTPHLAMPECCMVAVDDVIDPVASYRQYYEMKRRTIDFRYTGRLEPEWLLQM